jgi:molybdopterin-binding protein
LIMGVTAGAEAIAIINAASIILGNEHCQRFKISARNQLPAVIEQIHIGPAFAEVLLRWRLSPGMPLRNSSLPSTTR